MDNNYNRVDVESTTVSIDPTGDRYKDIKMLNLIFNCYVIILVCDRLVTSLKEKLVWYIR